MSDVYNFCAGPATLPKEVLQQAKKELTDWNNGLSVMEVSHRSPEFEALAAESEQDLRDLLNIPNNYKVLFLQGGAQGQFSAIPMNILGTATEADYLNTGIWSKKAIREAEKHCKVNVIASSEPQYYTTIPEQSQWKLSDKSAYLHITNNETIGGLELHTAPKINGTPLVSDMSSTILSRPINISDYSLIYAGAQKNIGPSGLTIVIVRDDLLNKAKPYTPNILHYKSQAENNSMLNTPPTFSWYLASLVFKWLKKQGGLQAMAEINHRKAEKLYNFIDEHAFYDNPIDPKYRSLMNIPFRLKDETFNTQFLENANNKNLRNLKGHKSVGGMRASIYNAMPEKGVDKLIEFMAKFAQNKS